MLMYTSYTSPLRWGHPRKINWINFHYLSLCIRSLTSEKRTNGQTRLMHDPNVSFVQRFYCTCVHTLTPILYTRQFTPLTSACVGFRVASGSPSTTSGHCSLHIEHRKSMLEPLFPKGSLHGTQYWMYRLLKSGLTELFSVGSAKLHARNSSTVTIFQPSL